MSEETRQQRTNPIRRWAWVILIAALAIAGIILSLADTSSRLPNPIARGIAGPTVFVTAKPGSTPAAYRFDRSRLGDRFVFDPAIGLGPLSPYSALRVFLSNGAGLVLLALAALVLFPSRARTSVERLEAKYGAEIALGAGLVDRKSVV